MTISGKPASRILGTGRAVPDRILTNADLEKIVDTTDEWITTRTGIKQRHIIEPGTANSDLASEAAKKALEKAGISADQLDMIIIGTVTGDRIFPATAVYVQTKIGAKNAACFDIAAACSGFLYGLHMADMAIRNGQNKYVLVVGSELLTTITNYEDRKTCVLFGDGSGAAVLGPSDGEKGILSSYIGSNGDLAHLLYSPGGGSIKPAKDKDIPAEDFTIHMAGNEVFKHAVKTMGDAAIKSLDLANKTKEDVDLLIPHQANIRIVDATAKRLRLPSEKVYRNIERYGNTSSASIPIALDEAFEFGRLSEGDIVLCVAFGGGFTWGSTLLQF